MSNINSERSETAEWQDFENSWWRHLAAESVETGEERMNCKCPHLTQLVKRGR